MNIALCRRALDDQLRREQPKARQIAALVREHRQVAVEIDDLLAFGAAGKAVGDLDAAIGKDGKLYLGHAPHSGVVDRAR